MMDGAHNLTKVAGLRRLRQCVGHHRSRNDPPTPNSACPLVRPTSLS